MTTHHCGTDHHNNTRALADCAVAATLLADLVSYADRYGVDPDRARALWLDMQRTDDPVFAARAVRGAIRANWGPRDAA